MAGIFLFQMSRTYGSQFTQLPPCNGLKSVATISAEAMPLHNTKSKNFWHTSIFEGESSQALLLIYQSLWPPMVGSKNFGTLSLPVRQTGLSKRKVENAIEKMASLPALPLLLARTCLSADKAGSAIKGRGVFRPHHW